MDTKKGKKVQSRAAATLSANKKRREATRNGDLLLPRQKERKAEAVDAENKGGGRKNEEK